MGLQADLCLMPGIQRIKQALCGRVHHGVNVTMCKYFGGKRVSFMGIRGLNKGAFTDSGLLRCDSGLRIALGGGTLRTQRMTLTLTIDDAGEAAVAERLLQSTGWTVESESPKPIGRGQDCRLPEAQAKRGSSSSSKRSSFLPSTVIVRSLR
jgi:hypothetical protein